MSLLETYEQQKAAIEKTAEENEEKVASAEDMEILQKYAAAADDLLSQEFGEDYKEEDVVELASRMINHDAQEAEAEAIEAEKTASLEEAGRIIAKGFLAEINEAG